LKEMPDVARDGEYRDARQNPYDPNHESPLLHSFDLGAHGSCRCHFASARTGVFSGLAGFGGGASGSTPRGGGSVASLAFSSGVKSATFVSSLNCSARM